MTHRQRNRTKSQRKTTRLAILTVLALGLIWFAPSLVAKTPLRNLLLAPLDEQVVGSIEMGSASLGWLSPVRLNNVVLRHRDGRPLATIPQIAMSNSLLALAWNPGQLGEIVLSGPEIIVESRENGTNVEDMFGHLFASDDKPAEIVITVAVSDATFIIRDATRDEEWKFERANARFSAPDSGSDFSLGLELAELADSPTTSVSTDLTWPRHTSGKTSIRVSATDFPSEITNLLRHRGMSLVQTEGLFSGHMDGRLQFSENGSATGQIAGEVNSQRLLLQLPGIVKERITVNNVSSPWKARFDERGFHLDECQLTCDLGNLQLSGEFAGLGRTSLLKTATTDGFECVGSMEIARLAQQLPYTLRLHDGTEFLSGNVSWSFHTTSTSEGTAFRGGLNTSNLSARRASQEFTWEEPVTARFDARLGTGGLIVNALECQSSFISLAASGTPQTLSINGTCDLERLRVELARFIDFNSLQLAGKAALHADWQYSLDGGFGWKSSTEIRNVVIGDDAGPWMDEESLHAVLNVSGALRGAVPARVDSARIDLSTSSEQFHAELLETVADPSYYAPWKVEFNAAGTFSRGLIATMLGTHDFAAGDYDASGIVRFDDYRVDFENLAAKVTRLRFSSGVAPFGEGEIKLTGDGSWNSSTNVITFARLDVKSERGNVQLEKAAIDFSAKSPKPLQGRFAFAMEIGGMIDALFSTVDSEYDLSGILNAKGDIENIDGKSSVRIQAEIDPVRLSWRPSNDQPYQDRLSLVTQLEHDQESEIWTIANFDLAANLLRIKGGGSLKTDSVPPRLAVAGQIQYDLAQVTALLRPRWADDIQLTGKHTKPFRWDGPLGSAALEPGHTVSWKTASVAEASFGWDSATLFSLPVESGQIDARMKDGAILLKPLDISCGGGRLSLAPRIDMSSSSTRLSLNQGQVVRNVSLTPDVCSSALKYTAPLLAAATSADGELSLRLTKCELPLEKPAAGELEGTVSIHNGQVGPGPLVREILSMVAGIATVTQAGQSTAANGLGNLKLMTVSEQDIDFRMVDGRIYHRDYSVNVGDVELRSYGSVGLDETLAIMVQVPLQQQWFQNRPRLASALGNQVVEVPIRGTLSRPQVDAEVFQQFTGRFIERAAEDVIFGEIGRQLDRLLGPSGQSE